MAALNAADLAPEAAAMETFVITYPNRVASDCEAYRLLVTA
jgi:hypothetical protein